jgi:prolyl 4-hydroxylase
MAKPDPRLAQALALVETGRKGEGILLLNQLAALNEPAALHVLADWKWQGGLVPQALPQARDLYRRAGEAGNAAAATAYTNLLATGIAGPRDWKRALKRLGEEARRDPKRKRALSLVQRMEIDAQGDPRSLPEIQELSQSPEVRLYPQLFSSAECDYLSETAAAGFRPSVVVDVRTGRDYADPVRTSEGSTFHWLIEDPAVHALNRRLAAASGAAYEQGEPLQILRYRPGQQYRNHMDFIPRVENPRVLTVLIYLNEGYQGGETCFVKTGLKVKGRKGDALVFRNSGPDRRADPMSEHAGLPVTSGTKLLASRWICEARHIP